MHIALIAHDAKKDLMVALARDFVPFLSRCHVMATAIYPGDNKTTTHMGGEGAPWLGQAWSRAKVLVVNGGEPGNGRPHPIQALLRDDHLLLLDAAEAPAGERLFLGEDDEGTPYFAVMAPLPDLPGARPVTILDAGSRKELDIEVIVPVDDMTQPSAAVQTPGAHSANVGIWS